MLRLTMVFCFGAFLLVSGCSSKGVVEGKNTAAAAAPTAAGNPQGVPAGEIKRK